MQSNRRTQAPTLDASLALGFPDTDQEPRPPKPATDRSGLVPAVLVSLCLHGAIIVWLVGSGERESNPQSVPPGQAMQIVSITLRAPPGERSDQQQQDATQSLTDSADDETPAPAPAVPQKAAPAVVNLPELSRPREPPVMPAPPQTAEPAATRTLLPTLLTLQRSLEQQVQPFVPDCTVLQSNSPVLDCPEPDRDFGAATRRLPESFFARPRVSSREQRDARAALANSDPVIANLQNLPDPAGVAAYAAQELEENRDGFRSRSDLGIEAINDLMHRNESAYQQAKRVLGNCPVC